LWNSSPHDLSLYKVGKTKNNGFVTRESDAEMLVPGIYAVDRGPASGGDISIEVVQFIEYLRGARVVSPEVIKRDKAILDRLRGKCRVYDELWDIREYYRRHPFHNS
jgi:hypothetical protein